MNTREKFEEMLVNNGMFEHQAKEVMDIAIPIIDGTVKGYKFTWNRPYEEYPIQVYSVIWGTTVKEIALKWINENMPLAWYKPLLE
jgi:hypothetical protein